MSLILFFFGLVLCCLLTVNSRPTAVNLMYCCDKIIEDLKNFSDGSVAQRVCRQASEETVEFNIVSLAEQMLQKEIDMNDSMAKLGASLIKDGDGILTHCNTGTLATPGKGSN